MISLDISTNNIGFGLWEQEKYKLGGSLDISKIEDLYKKLDFFKEFLVSKKSEGFKKVVIEKSFTAMFGGKSSAKTTELLSKFNFACQYLAYQEGYEVEMLNVKTARSLAFPGISLGTGREEVKEKILKLYVEEVGKDFLKEKVLKSGKRKGQTVFEDFCEDIADAYVVGKGFLKFQTSASISLPTKKAGRKSNKVKP